MAELGPSSEAVGSHRSGLGQTGAWRGPSRPRGSTGSQSPRGDGLWEGPRGCRAPGFPSAVERMRTPDTADRRSGRPRRRLSLHRRTPDAHFTSVTKVSVARTGSQGSQRTRGFGWVNGATSSASSTRLVAARPATASRPRAPRPARPRLRPRRPHWQPRSERARPQGHMLPVPRPASGPSRVGKRHEESQRAGAERAGDVGAPAASQGPVSTLSLFPPCSPSTTFLLEPVFGHASSPREARSRVSVRECACKFGLRCGNMGCLKGRREHTAFMCKNEENLT